MSNELKVGLVLVWYLFIFGGLWLFGEDIAIWFGNNIA